MLAVHLENGGVEMRELPRPGRPPGFALIRLLCGGICNTDLELQRGYYAFAGTPGHEFVGEVVEADTRELLGRRVVGEINLACGGCDWCRKGFGRHCPERTVLGIVRHPGAFGEYLTLPERNLHVVPDSIPTEAAVFTEPLAAAYEILDQAPLACNSRVAVLGDGKLGLLAAQVLHAYGHRVEQFGRHAEKLAIARRAGVETHAGGELPQAEFAWVVEATGSPEGLRQAVRMVRPRGTVILKSTVHGHVSMDTAPVVVNEVTLVGSRCGRFEPALELLRAGVIDTQAMISARLPLSEAPAAFAQAAAKGAMKVLLT
ncbi:MAG TPA: alcohol dehydrogenase catalytic domain-containing protein [Bryobacteraceae bacterium]|nr:alcohol dehydrogenase catalytic domain-containing protein [Bryobacteraceae bacterium]